MDEGILRVLRADLALAKKDFIFHDILMNCWSRIIRDGLKREEKTEIMNKYSRKENCRIEAPITNEEIDSFINEKLRKRNSFFVMDKSIASTRLSALARLQ